MAYEGSSHVPLVIAPGKDFPSLAFRGRVRDLTSHVDMMPTFLGLAGDAARSALRSLLVCFFALFEGVSNAISFIMTGTHTHTQHTHTHTHTHTQTHTSTRTHTYLHIVHL